MPVSLSVLLELPVLVVYTKDMIRISPKDMRIKSLLVKAALTKRAHLSGLQPPRNAVEVEGVVADTPSHGALVPDVGHLVGLALDAYNREIVSDILVGIY